MIRTVGSDYILEVNSPNSDGTPTEPHRSLEVETEVEPFLFQGLIVSDDQRSTDEASEDLQGQRYDKESRSPSRMHFRSDRSKVPRVERLESLEDEAVCNCHQVVVEASEEEILPVPVISQNVLTQLIQTTLIYGGEDLKGGSSNHDCHGSWTRVRLSINYQDVEENIGTVPEDKRQGREQEIVE